MTPQERFEQFCIPEPNTGCLLWTGAVQRDGYGAFYFEGKKRTATRVALRLRGVEVTDGAFVCHRCDNSYCVNPDHLYVGDMTTNMRDTVKRGQHANASKTECLRGHALSPDNTYTFGRSRQCRACRRITHAVRKARRKP